MIQQREIPVRCHGVSVILLKHEAAIYKVLLLRRTGSTLAGEWCQVAGGIEPGETAWQTALSETREETGLVPDCLYSADICEQFYVPDQDAIFLAPVFVGYTSSDQNVILNPEHSEFIWTTFEDAMTKVPFAGQRTILDHVRREFVDRSPNPWLLIDTISG